MVESRRCPGCKAYIQLPLRRQNEAFRQHVKKCSPDDFQRMLAMHRELTGEDAREAVASGHAPQQAQRDPLAGEIMHVIKHDTSLLDRTKGGDWVDADYRWVLFCGQHATTLGHPTRMGAEALLYHPTEWCEAHREATS